jgi:hypothetical protein
MLTPEAPARLFRSHAGPSGDRAVEMEEIGSGPLIKMARLALGDPDSYLYPYRVVAGEQVFDGDEILTLGRQLGLCSDGNP